MTQYHKIQSLFKRDEKGNFIFGDFSCPEFEYLWSSPWEGTEKIDGTNIRIYKAGVIGGRTDNAQIPAFLLPVLENVKAKLEESDLPESTILYGEGYGNKIQKGGHYIPNGNAFCLFDVKINNNYQPRESVEDIANKINLRVAPILEVTSLFSWVNKIKQGHYSESILHPGARNEGVVLRPLVELQTRTGERIITKLKFKDFK